VAAEVIKRVSVLFVRMAKINGELLLYRYAQRLDFPSHRPDCCAGMWDTKDVVKDGILVAVRAILPFIELNQAADDDIATPATRPL
jgi:hypothetical protein